jgi:cytochrome b
MMSFRNPSNDYVEEVSAPAFFTLLFGCIYFAVRGVWTHAIAAFLLAIVTFGFSWLIYPFFAGQIMRTHYLRKGWEQVDQRAIALESAPDSRGHSTLGLPAIIAIAALIAAMLASGLLTQHDQQAPGSAVEAPMKRQIKATDSAQIPLPRARPH